MAEHYYGRGEKNMEQFSGTGKWLKVFRVLFRAF